MLIPLEDVKQGGLFKYVRVKPPQSGAVGQYRFTYNDFLHSSLLNESETAETAGTISVFDTYWRLASSYSTTLKVGADNADLDSLTKLLDRPMAGPY